MAWHCKAKGAYAQDSSECEDNAREVYSYLSGQGWGINAICGVLGNMWAESGMNPWRWQSDSVQPTSNSPWWNRGYGLVQFTEAGTYINLAAAKANSNYGPNFSNKSGKDTDGLCQLYVIDTNATYGYIKTRTYNMTYHQFKTSDLPPSELAIAWLLNYERPASVSEEVRKYRGGLADFFYEMLSGSSPSPRTYKVTVQVKGNGTASASVTSAQAGEIITLEESAGYHYKFDGWTVVSGGASISDNSFVMPSSNVTILANFVDIDIYDISVSTTGGGTAYADSDTAYSGSTVQLYESAEEGYEFTRWDVLYGRVYIDSDNTFIMPKRNVVIRAVFTQIGGTPIPEPDPNPEPASYHSITVIVDGTGNGTASASASYAEDGDRIYLSETPDENSTFTRWEVFAGGVYVSGDSFTMGDEDVVIFAVFTINRPPTQYHITIEIKDGGTGKGRATSIPYGVALEGETVYLFANDIGHVKFRQWTGFDGIEDTKSPETSFTMPAHDVIIYAWFNFVGKWWMAMRPSFTYPYW